MAVSSTVLTDAIALLGEGNTFNAYENRLDQYNVTKFFMDNADKLAPKDFIENNKISARRPVKLPVLNATTNAFISTRDCDIAVPTNNSTNYTLTYVTLGFTAGIVPAVFQDNYISKEAALSDQIKSGVKSVFTQLETLGVAALEAGKTSVFSSTLFANDTTAYNLTLAQKEDFYKSLPAVMKRQILDYPVYDDIANTESIVMQEFLYNQGAANSTNTNYQFQPGSRYNFYRSNGITPGAGIGEVHYVAAPAAGGLYSWIDIDAQMRNKVSEGQFWDVMTDPIMGEEWGVYYKGACVDASAQLAGLERSFSQAWEFTKDFAFVTARNSTGDTPIVKFTIANV